MKPTRIILKGNDGAILVEEEYLRNIEPVCARDSRGWIVIAACIDFVLKNAQRYNGMAKRERFLRTMDG